MSPSLPTSQILSMLHPNSEKKFKCKKMSTIILLMEIEGQKCKIYIKIPLEWEKNLLNEAVIVF